MPGRSATVTSDHPHFTFPRLSYELGSVDDVLTTAPLRHYDIAVEKFVEFQYWLVHPHCLISILSSYAISYVSAVMSFSLTSFPFPRFSPWTSLKKLSCCALPP